MQRSGRAARVRDVVPSRSTTARRPRESSVRAMMASNGDGNGRRCPSIDDAAVVKSAAAEVALGPCAMARSALASRKNCVADVKSSSGKAPPRLAIAQHRIFSTTPAQSFPFENIQRYDTKSAIMSFGKLYSYAVSRAMSLQRLPRARLSFLTSLL
jgi:hypothetical protein